MMTPTPEPGVMSLEMVLLYLDLRRAGLIGQLWVEAGHYHLAPLDAAHAYAFNAKELIFRDRLEALLVRLQQERTGTLPERIAPHSVRREPTTTVRWA